MGRRGPRPTPTAQLRLVGSRELEHRHNEPQPALGAPNPPTWLSAEARAEWKRVAPELIRVGVLARVDRAILVGYCESWAMFPNAQRLVHDTGLIPTSKATPDARAAAGRAGPGQRLHSAGTHARQENQSGPQQ